MRCQLDVQNLIFEMKKIFLGSLLVFCGAITYAQVPSIGLKAGMNIATTKDGFGSGLQDLFKNPNFKGGLTAGAFVHIPLPGPIAIQPELLFSSEGSLQDGQIGASNTYVNVFKLTMNYLQIPVMFQYNAPKGFYLEAGPQIGFLLSSELLNKFPGTGSGSTTTDMKEILKGSNFALAGGVGYNFKSGLGIGARYTQGISNPYDGPEDFKLTGSNIYLGLHYRFLGKKK